MIRIQDIAKQAGRDIMNIYNSSMIISQTKNDNSPITNADLISNKIIIEGIKKISTYPILTEECYVTYSRRKKWDKFWLIDPLDGTKDFIEKNGDFTINIALIENSKPIYGVVYMPLNNTTYFAIKNYGAYKNRKKIYNNSTRKKLIGSDSNFH